MGLWVLLTNVFPLAVYLSFLWISWFHGGPRQCKNTAYILITSFPNPAFSHITLSADVSDLNLFMNFHKQEYEYEFLGQVFIFTVEMKQSKVTSIISGKLKPTFIDLLTGVTNGSFK